MFRFRRLRTAALKSFAILAIAMGLSVSVAIAVPTQSYAAVPIGQALVKAAPVVLRAVPAIPAAAVAAGVSIGPVGWTVLGVAALGIGLLATSDYWLPYVTGDLGEGNEDAPSQEATGTLAGKVFPGGAFTLGSPSKSPNIITLPTNFVCATTCTVNLHVAYRIQCKAADGTTRILGGIFNYVNRATPLGPVTASCIYTEGGVTHSDDPVAFEAGIAGDGALPLRVSTDKLYGAANHVFWGEWVEGGFDPNSPDMEYDTAVDCVKNSDGSHFTAHSFTKGDQGGVQVPSCGAGAHGVGVKFYSKPPGSEVYTLQQTIAPTNDPAYPLCSLTQPNPCVMSIKLDNEPCTAGVWACENWAQVNQTNPERIQCAWGPYTIATASCNLLERAYEKEGARATDKNTDGDPATRDNVDVVGNPLDAPPVDSAGAPGDPNFLDVITGGISKLVGDIIKWLQDIVGWLGQIFSEIGLQIGNLLSGLTDAIGDVGGQVWEFFKPFADGVAASFNGALDWLGDIFQAIGQLPAQIGAAIEMLFIPQESVVARIGTEIDVIQGSAPFSWLVPGAAIGGPGGGGCPDWNIHVGSVDRNVVCGSSFTQAIRDSRGAIFGIVSFAMVWPLIRSLWYAAIPFVRVQPSGSK